METLFDQYKELNINGSLICLEQVEDIYSYFCYPTNAKAIGFEGSIMYCFIEPYGEMVFACNPDTCADVFVYPLARTFEDFMRLILACGSTNPIEQIIWMDKDKFEKHLKEEEAIRTEEQKATLSYLETELEISPIDNPYDYVKELQSRFDNSGIEYMVIVMVTPFYSDLAALSQPARLAYCFNPFAHVTSLIGGSFGQLMLCDPLISAAILVLLTAILGALSVKRWYSSHAAEKLGVF